MLYEILLEAEIAGLLASLACGLGALPLLFKEANVIKNTGIGYGFAGGLMFSASVYNLILPSLTTGPQELGFLKVFPIIIGILCGALFLWLIEHYIDINSWKEETLKNWGGKSGILIFLAMAIHSIPEGFAVGVGYTQGEIQNTELGYYIALAIAIHNIPEGLAVAIPMRAAGASVSRCFLAAFLTSLPQPIAAIPAVFLSWFFQPLMPALMGFAAGAMIFLVLLEMIPDALHQEKAVKIAWAFMFGFCLMLLIQTIL